MYKGIKVFVLFILIICCIINVNAVMCKDKIMKNGINTTVYDFCSIESGVPYQVYTIHKCEGQVTISVRTKLKNDGYYLNEFTKQNEKIWTATCRNNMPIILSTNSKTTNEFDIIMEYYTQEKISTGNKDKDELHNSIYRKTITFNNIRVNYKVNEPNINIFDLEQLGSSLYLIFGIIVIVIVILSFIGVYSWKSIFYDKKNVISGEKRTTKTLNEELDDILKDL